MHEPMKARSAGVTELTRLELKPLGINNVRLREDLTDGVIAHRDDVLAAPVVRAAAQAADESQDRALMAVLSSWIAAQLRSPGGNFGANRYNDFGLTEVRRRKAFDLLCAWCRNGRSDRYPLARAGPLVPARMTGPARR